MQQKLVIWFLNWSNWLETATKMDLHGPTNYVSLPIVWLILQSLWVPHVFAPLSPLINTLADHWCSLWECMDQSSSKILQNAWIKQEPSAFFRCVWLTQILRHLHLNRKEMPHNLTPNTQGLMHTISPKNLDHRQDVAGMFVYLNYIFQHN